MECWIIFPTGYEMKFSFWLDNREQEVSLKEKGHNILQVSLGEKTYNVSFELLSESEVLLNIDGRVFNIIINSNAP